MTVMSRTTAVVVWVVITSTLYLGAVLGAHERETRRVILGSVDLDHPIDDTQVKATLIVGGDRQETLASKREEKSDFEREKRREMDAAKDRERERNKLPRKNQISLADELVLGSQTNGMERKRESDQQEEINREIYRAEERKWALLREEPMRDRLTDKFNSQLNDGKDDRSEHNSQRQIDRALRGGDALERNKSKLARDTLRVDEYIDWTHSQVEAQHRYQYKEAIHRKQPILIIEKIPVSYSDSADSGHYPDTPFVDSYGDGNSDLEAWYESSENNPSFEASLRGTPHVDPRAPDLPVALPRPNTAFTDRRPDRPDYPYKYDEMHTAFSPDSAERQTELFDEDHSDHTFHLSPKNHDQSFPAASAISSPPLDMRNPHALPLSIPGLTVTAYADAAKTQVALQQVLIAERTLHAQAIQAGKIKQAAVTAHLIGQAAAQQRVAQQVKAQQIAAQLIAADKAAQLDRIIVGNEAIKAAIQTKLEHEKDHRFKKLISQKTTEELPLGTGVEVQLADVAVTPPLATKHFQQHHRFLAGNVDQIREELIHRLTLLKPYFERTSSGFAVPSIIPNLPGGMHLTPLQVEALPKITLQVPNELVKPASLRIRDFDGELHSSLNPEYVEYLMGLPDDLFREVTNVSKPQFLATLFPRLYRNSVHHLYSLTTTGILGYTSDHTLPTTTPFTPYASMGNRYSQSPPPSYKPPFVKPFSHTTVHPSMPHLFSHSLLTPGTQAPPPDKISINKLFRGRPVAGFHVSKEPNITRSISFKTLHTSTTMPPPLPSSLGYGDPKPSSIIELDDILCHKCINKDNHQHHHDHEQHNQQEHSHAHTTKINKGFDSSYQHIHHHYVHHHLQSVVSSSPASSSPFTVSTHFYSSLNGSKAQEHHKSHEHLLKGQVHVNKGDSVPRSEGVFVASTAASSMVAGVGLRPHGGHQKFITPIYSSVHDSSSPLPNAPLAPTTSINAPMTSSYTSYLPTAPYQKDLTSTPLPVSSNNPLNHIIHSLSAHGTTSPSTTYAPLNSEENFTRRSPFITIQPFIFTTNTTRPHSLVSDTPVFQPDFTRLVPAISPVFVVTESPATADSSTVFLFSPSVPFNGHFLPVSDDVSSYKKFQLPDLREETDSSTRRYMPATSLEEQRLASKKGSDLDRVPGSDSNDDDHILSPFIKRKGNVTDDMQENLHLHYIATSPSSGNSLAQKKHPVPQLVDTDGLPLAAGSKPDLHPPSHGSQGLRDNRQSATGWRPSTGKGLSDLPPYLKVAPPCANVPSNKSFCIMPHGYPSELASAIVNIFSEELAEVRRVLSQLIESKTPESSQDFSTGISTSEECETEEKTVELSWSRDILGNWFAILQTDPFIQPTAVITCSVAARLKGCRPLLRPRPLLALQPLDPEPRPVVLEFPLPVACVLPDLQLRAFPVFDGVTSADPSVTPPFPDYNLDDQSSDVVIRRPDNSMKSAPSESKRSYLSKISPFTEQQHQPLHLPSPPTHAITNIPMTSQTFPRISLSVRPGTLPKMPVEDSLPTVFLTQYRMKNKVKFLSGSAPPMPTHAVISFSVTVSLLAQVQLFYCQPLNRLL